MNRERCIRVLKKLLNIIKTKKENITSNSSEEMSALCSLMDFVYLGRIAKSEIQN